MRKLVILNQPRRDIKTWPIRSLAESDRVILAKLAAVGLIKPLARATLGEFIDDYAKGRTDVKGSTQIVYQRGRRYLVEYFGEKKPLQDISRGDADAWRLSLLAKPLAENTVRKSCGIAKQLFTAAVRQQLISMNPFEDLPSVVKANHKRFYFVTREETDSVLNACPDAEWKLLFALARYGGLRCPSEVLLLRWGDVNWADSKLTVRSPKTEHLEGKDSRVIPIFPELLPHLQLAFDQALAGSEFCINRYRTAGINLRTQLTKIIHRAGLKPWPKLWQNLRSTRETELMDQFPAHVVCAWIGNSMAVAAKHYLQTTDDHFARATKATRIPTQQVPADSRTEAQQSEVNPDSSGECSESQPLAAQCVTDDGPYWT